MLPGDRVGRSRVQKEGLKGEIKSVELIYVHYLDVMMTHRKCARVCV